jgi:ribosomal protein S18 acetylase RimI-like enzyme
MKNISIDADLTMINKLSDEHKVQLLDLYQHEWWSNGRTINNVETIINGSSFIIAFINETNNELVAFCRILTDHFKHAYIYDVIVAEEFRKTGLGKKLIDSVLSHKELSNISNIELVCRRELVPFYKQFGFSEDYGLSIAMRC